MYGLARDPPGKYSLSEAEQTVPIYQKEKMCKEVKKSSSHHSSSKDQKSDSTSDEPVAVSTIPQIRAILKHRSLLRNSAEFLQSITQGDSTDTKVGKTRNI
jgi:hypothetical protein